MYAEDKITAQRYGQPETEQVKQPQVQEAIQGLESVIEQSLMMVADMEQRLTPVLRSEPEAAGSNSKDAPTSVPIAARINEATVRLNRLLDHYRSILRRLEV